MTKLRTYYPSVVLAEMTVAHYKVVASKIGYYNDERVGFMVEFMNGFKRVEQVTYPTEALAMRLYTYWTEEVIPVQLAKEAFGLSKPLVADPISKAERVNQP